MTQDRKTSRNTHQRGTDLDTGMNDSRPGQKPTSTQREIGGRKGPEPTRYGDWEKNGLISDF